MCLVCANPVCGGLCIFHACVDCEWVEAVWKCGDCVSVCLCGDSVGGLLNILVDVAFPPFYMTLVRPFYARDSFMKHKTWSNTWHKWQQKRAK